MADKLRIAVVSPFLDRRHGTERCIVEQIERFAREPDCEIHLYAQRVEDLPVVPSSGTSRSAPAGRILWHKVPRLPGPHLVGYVWWFLANHAKRSWDSWLRGLRVDLVYSPGINAFNADAISVHVVFQELYRRVRPSLRLRGTPAARWPVLLHRRLYYLLICFLERRIYSRPNLHLSAISRHTAEKMTEFFQRRDVSVIRYGVDTRVFNPSARRQRRDGARMTLGIGPQEFCLLLIGNDWKNKGLDALLRSLSACADCPFRLLVVGEDDPRAYLAVVEAQNLQAKVRFLSPCADVMQFYAAADVYAGPSLEDAYGLPVLEAMSCGLPAIASARAGVSEIIRNGENGFCLQDPEDSQELATLLRRIYAEPDLRLRVGEQAARTAQSETWDCNAASTWKFLQAALDSKRRSL